MRRSLAMNKRIIKGTRDPAGYPCTRCAVQLFGSLRTLSAWHRGTNLRHIQEIGESLQNMMMGFSSSAALSATLWPPSELLCRAWVTTLLRPVSGPSSGYTELLASLDWPRALSRSTRVNMESKDWRQWSEIQEDEGHGDGIVQGGGGLVDGAPRAAVLDQPHLPLWGRHLLPGHRRQHGQTCTGRALH